MKRQTEAKKGKMSLSPCAGETWGRIKLAFLCTARPPMGQKGTIFHGGSPPPPAACWLLLSSSFSSALQHKTVRSARARPRRSKNAAYSSRSWKTRVRTTVSAWTPSSSCCEPAASGTERHEDLSEQHGARPVQGMARGRLQGPPVGGRADAQLDEPLPPDPDAVGEEGGELSGHASFGSWYHYVSLCRVIRIGSK